MMTWGRKAKVYTSSKSKYNELVKKYSQYFPSISVLFQIAAAVGIVLEEQKELEKNQELINTYSIDKDGTLALLMEIMYPDLTPEERLKELEKYAEVGIERIYEDVTLLGTFNIKKYLHDETEF